MADYFANIAGNEPLRSRLAAEILSGSFPHAYIIEGAAGSGRKTLALSAAAALSCEKKDSDSLPCFECPACRKIFGGKTPDVIRVATERDKVSIGVESARFVRQDVLTVPNDFNYKVYIIEDADKMTLQAQNALLLTLEEPPRYAVFFLICQSASSLLETVRSRAPVLRTGPLPPQTVLEYIISHDPRAAELAKTSPDELAEIVSASRGRIGEALSLLDPKTRKPINERRRLAKNFIGLFSSVAASPSSAKFDVIASFPQKREDAALELSFVSEALRDLILLKKSENAPLIFWSDRDEALEISSKFTLAGLFSLSGRIDNATELLGRNANLRLTLINLISAPPA